MVISALERTVAPSGFREIIVPEKRYVLALPATDLSETPSKKILDQSSRLTVIDVPLKVSIASPSSLVYSTSQVADKTLRVRLYRISQALTL